MKGWSQVALTDICTSIDYGYTASSSNIPIGPKFLRITDIATNIVNWDEVPYCTISEIDKNKYKLSAGDIVIARTGASTGATYTIKESDPKDLVFASYLIRYRINKKIAIPSFIGKLLTSTIWKNYVAGVAGGSAQPGANAKVLGSFSILLPPLDEQRAIAAVLSSLDDKIDLLNRQNVTLEAMAEALFRQWFVVEAKEEWEDRYLKDEFNIFIGRTPPRKEQTCFSFESGEIWISIKDMGNPGVFISDSSEYLTQKAIYTYNIPLIPKNSVVLSFKMTVGRVKITTAPMYSNEAIACFVPITGSLLSQEFLYLFLKQYKYDELGSTSSIVTAINSNMIKNISLKIPPISVLKYLNKHIIPLFEKIKSNQTQIRTLAKLRDTLLPKLMSGEVRVDF